MTDNVEKSNHSDLQKGLDYFFNDQMEKMVCGNPRTRDGFVKMQVRPVIIKDDLRFQIEELTDKQAFHKNLVRDEAISYVIDRVEALYRNAEIFSQLGSMNVLVSKKNMITVKIKKKMAVKEDLTEKLSGPLTHNRKKKYVLEEGIPVPFLTDLGVMTKEGLVVKAKYDKFRQINRFLEFIEDILPRINREKETTIIDFGCGKSYLTFAMYYYLKELKGYPIKVVGLDLKKDVIVLCNHLSEKFGFDNLHFYHGDIAGYEGVEHVDMVVTLHACNTATDHAISKAVKWGADVILSVPCCQHEVNGQIESELLKPVLQYGLLKERISALVTDGIRAELLERAGYRTQILEFIDMEHTPKNIMIRAVRQGRKKQGQELEQMLDQLRVEPALYGLFREQGIV